MNKTEIRTVRDRVAEMYERHPYPKVDEDFKAYASGEAWLLESPNPSFHLYWPHDEMTDGLDIFLAGCGTQQAAQVAASIPMQGSLRRISQTIVSQRRSGWRIVLMQKT